MDIDAALVRKLIADQFPAWSALNVVPVLPGGWDNRTFRLGENLLVRLPSALAYAGQVERDKCWLARLATNVPLAIPEVLAMGKPAHGFPHPWAVYRWLEGENAHSAVISDLRMFATDLAGFLLALQQIDATGAPEPDLANFYRGGQLRLYHAEVRQALRVLQAKIDLDLVTSVWESACASSWQKQRVWVHGDISPGNLLIRGGRLNAVIDFGQLAAGDPACDLAIAWTFLDRDSRRAFRTAMRVDDATWDRGRGWALWKALIVAAGLARTNAAEFAEPHDVIAAVIAEFQSGDRA